jgi:ABC-type dipeptide/oligopeptide/nickel transport system ATPase component
MRDDSRQRDRDDLSGADDGALNPVFTVEKQLTEGLDQAQGHVEDGQARERALELMRQVRIPEPERPAARSIPTSCLAACASGVVIAIALACEPRHS